MSRGCRVTSTTDPHGHYSRFCSLEPLLFSFKELLSYPYKAKWTPFQTHYYSENLVALGMEPEISDQ
jgi:hypothetical protein